MEKNHWIILEGRQLWEDSTVCVRGSCLPDTNTAWVAENNTFNSGNNKINISFMLLCYYFKKITRKKECYKFQLALSAQELMLHLFVIYLISCHS